MRRDKVMIQARDGGYIVPEMKVLKSYIEQELETVIISRDRVEDTSSHYESNQPHIDKTKAKKVQFEDDTMENALNQLKELNNKIKEQQRPRIQDQEEKKEIKDFIKQIKELTEAVLPQNKTGQCYYCLEEGYSVNRCNYLFDDQNKKWVSRQGGGFLFPNWQRVPTDGKTSPKRLVEEFAKEKEEVKKKMKEDEAKESLPKPKEMSIIQLRKDNSATAIAKAESWGNWKPPTISSANAPLLNNYGFRNTKERNSRAENTNQDALRSHSKVKTPIKKRPNIPGTYIEDEHKKEVKTIIPTKYKKPQLVKNEKEILPQEPKIYQTENTQEPIKKFKERKIVKEEKGDIQEIMAQIIKKVLDQKINLNLKQILVMSPKFFNQLKNFSEEEKNSINSIYTKEI
ncbi:hypothetical protein O181_081422 [Austropuccinia psidii MF-1]|uniref:Uncharacterized protein n=1 Tax=Austropuccinia psidii MF-1 TaxID=1389203 RepID=A0A9Q3IIC3_9BASI|nr:hypothetical protein [Austropuccinia psidii MF-1]